MVAKLSADACIVVVVVVDIELLTEREAKGCGGQVGRGRDLWD